MGAELERACDRDRQLYYDHVDVLYAEGFIVGDGELAEVRDEILKARSMGDLDRVLTGMPLPEIPKEPRDWGIPKNFVPLFGVPAVGGVSLATLLPLVLGNFPGTPAKMISAAAILFGSLTVIACIIGMGIATAVWMDHGSDERRERRARDPGW